MDNTIPGPYGRTPSARPPAPAVYKFSVYLILALLVGLVLYHGLPAMIAGSRPPIKLVVYSFSTQEDVFSQHVLPAFESMWEAQNDRDLKIEAVFGPSGTMASQIVLGARKEQGNLQAHAWVEFDGIVLNDQSNIHEEFVSFGGWGMGNSD